MLICQRAVAKKNRRYSNLFEKKIDAVISTLSFSHLHILHIQKSSVKLFHDLHYKHIFGQRNVISK